MSSLRVLTNDLFSDRLKGGRINKERFAAG